MKVSENRRVESVAASAPDIIKSLAKSVAGGDVRPILLHSSENYLIESATTALATAWLGSAPDPLQLIKISCREFSADYFVATVLTFGMFVQRRLAILSDIDLLNADAVQLVADSLNNLPPDTLLICTTSSKKSAKSKLAKALQATGRVTELPTLRGMALVAWIRKIAQDQQLTLDPQVEAELVAVFSGDLYQLRSELAKLAAFKGSSGGAISIADLKAVMGRSSLHSIFDLTDALGEQNLVKARGELQYLLTAGENPGYIITMLEWHLANLWQCKAAPSSDPQTLAKTLSIHPYVAGKCLKQAANFRLEVLENAYLLAVESEYRLKAGKAPRLDVELDRLIVKTIAHC